MTQFGVATHSSENEEEEVHSRRILYDSRSCVCVCGGRGGGRKAVCVLFVPAQVSVSHRTGSNSGCATLMTVPVCMSVPVDGNRRCRNQRLGSQHYYIITVRCVVDFVSLLVKWW